MLTKGEKRKDWEFGININQLDGAWEPSKEFKELVEREIRGEITTDQMVAILVKKYTEIDK